MALQLGGVEVEPLPALGRCGAEGVEALLEPAAAAFEDAQSHISLGAGEEGEVHVEGVVLPG